MDMLIVGFLSWWYGAGWRQRAGMVKERIVATADYFSIDLLIKTLFAPFRQISAGAVSGPLGVRWRAFVDRLISRCIGGVMRSFLVVIGALWIIVTALLGGFTLLVWGALPLLPIVGIIMAFVGWVPTWM